MYYNKAISHLNNLRLEDNICKNGIISHHDFQESLKITYYYLYCVCVFFLLVNTITVNGNRLVFFL